MSNVGFKIPLNNNLTTHKSTNGTASTLGHVKLSDAYKTNGGDASASVGASSKAVNELYKNSLSLAEVQYLTSGNMATLAIGTYQINNQSSANFSNLPSEMLARGTIYGRVIVSVGFRLNRNIVTVIDTVDSTIYYATQADYTTIGDWKRLAKYSELQSLETRVAALEAK